MFTDDITSLSSDHPLQRPLGKILNPNETMAGMMSTKPNVHLTAPELQKFVEHVMSRGILTPNSSGLTELPDNALLISPGMLNAKTMAKKFGVSEAEATDLINRKILKTVLHETGHGVSEKAGLGGAESREIRDRLNSLYQAAATAKNEGNTSQLAILKQDIDRETSNFMRAKALEESRAETFSYHMLPQTKLGKQMLEETKAPEFRKSLEGSARSAETRQRTFTGTKYYNLGEGEFSKPFVGYYGDAGLGEGGAYKLIFGDDAVQETRGAADAVGTATMLRSNRFWRI
jgi:hypothetical protein